MKDTLNVLPGMRSNYTINKKKLSKGPDLGLSFEMRVGPGYEHLVEIGSRARK